MARQAPRVLVVEDEPASRELLRYNLEAEGFAVARPTTARKRCAVAGGAARPDPARLDAARVSGIEVRRLGRRDPATARTPIIMLSARGEEEDRVRGLATGADDYVVKPFRWPS